MLKLTKVGVRNMDSPRSDRPVANQYLISVYNKNGDTEREYFQSYQTIIGVKLFEAKDWGRVILDREAWDYSVTTGKYRNQWLHESIAETRQKIASGEYKLENLN